MSTNPKALTPKEISETIIAKKKASIDRRIRALKQQLEHENTLLAESPASRLQRVLKIYRGIEPLLTVLSSLPILPSTWRNALVMFNQALEALTLVGPEITNGFKAGKDL
jgi:hypothetical protein